MSQLRQEFLSKRRVKGIPLFLNTMTNFVETYPRQRMWKPIQRHVPTDEQRKRTRINPRPEPRNYGSCQYIKKLYYKFKKRWKSLDTVHHRTNWGNQKSSISIEPYSLTS